MVYVNHVIFSQNHVTLSETDRRTFIQQKIHIQLYSGWCVYILKMREEKFLLMSENSTRHMTYYLILWQEKLTVHVL